MTKSPNFFEFIKYRQIKCGDFYHIFVVFLEYMNFNSNPDYNLYLWDGQA